MLGRRIGTYEVISKLGEGGMGVVYVARHTTLGRLVAVKVLLPAFSNRRDIVTRFFNEARAATAIRHPGIVEVHDFGFLEDQLAYIIMEYLEGEGLAARLGRGPLSLAAVLTTTRGIARALHAAHEKGIVHRDLKPDNIFLVPDEEVSGGERVKLLDFGIAKLTFDADAQSHTHTGMIIGTPSYMAPEQCRGTSSIDLRADLYALGCVVYEMLSGRPPFVASAADVLAHHMYFEPQPVSALRPDVPPQLAQLVMALLAKDPAHRPESASAVVNAIDQLAVAMPVDQRPLPTPLPRAIAAPSAPTTLGGSASRGGAVTAPRQHRRHGRWIAIACAVLVVGPVAVFLVTQRSERSDAAITGTPPSGSSAAPADAVLVATVIDAPADSAPIQDAGDAGDGRSNEAQAKVATELNEEGKALMREKKWEAATKKFRAASALVPEPFYYYNLCISLMYEGAFGEALTACTHAQRNGPTPVLKQNITAVIARVHEEAKKQGISLEKVPVVKKSQAEIATRLDKEGQSLMYQEQWAPATAKFRAAIARDPQPLYDCHLCISLMHEGKFGEALIACDRGERRGPTPDVQAKLTRAIAKVHEVAKEQGISLKGKGLPHGDDN